MVRFEDSGEALPQTECHVQPAAIAKCFIRAPALPSVRYLARPNVRPSNVATFRQNVGCLSVTPALWRGAATSHFSPREV